MPKGYTFKDLQTESLKVMEEGEQDTSTLTELFQQCEGILEKVVRQQDTKVILPADILKRDSDELMKKESGMDAMIPEWLFVQKIDQYNFFKIFSLVFSEILYAPKSEQTKYLQRLLLYPYQLPVVINMQTVFQYNKHI